MITVLAGGALAGYSSSDHTIDDDQVREIVGTEFRTASAALKAAEKRVFRLALGREPKWINHPCAWVELRFASGLVREFRTL